MGIKGRLRRLERQSEGNTVLIPQQDGPPARFPEIALQDAFINNVQRLCGEDVETHPLCVAAARSPSPEWRKSMYAECWPERVRPPEPVPDLSEVGE